MRKEQKWKQLGNNGVDVNFDVYVKYTCGVIGESNNTIFFLMFSYIL